MSAVLVVTEGPLAGERLSLEGELVIGREGVAVTIEDSELSRRHASVRPVEGGFEVEDLGSLNGTYVNGRRIDAPTRLAGGDSLKLGQSVLQLELEVAQAQPTVAAAAPAAPVAPPPAPASSGPGVPSEPFGAHAAPEGMKRRRGVASRQLVPLLVSWAVVVTTAVALAIYFADHPT